MHFSVQAPALAQGLQFAKIVSGESTDAGLLHHAGFDWGSRFDAFKHSTGMTLYLHTTLFLPAAGVHGVCVTTIGAAADLRVSIGGRSLALVTGGEHTSFCSVGSKGVSSKTRDMMHLDVSLVLYTRACKCKNILVIIHAAIFTFKAAAKCVPKPFCRLLLHRGVVPQSIGAL